MSDEKLEYFVVAYGSMTELIDRINHDINNGWELQGGITQSEYTKFYMQAIVKRTKNDTTSNRG